MSVVSELTVVRAELSAMQAAKRDSETLRENENGGKLLQIGSRARRAAAAARRAGPGCIATLLRRRGQ